MATIPLPALHTAPIQQPQSPLEAYAQVLGIQKQQQANQMAQQEEPVRQQILGQQAQQGQMEIQQTQQAQQDNQTFRSAMQDPSNHGKTIGDIADTLVDSGHLSPQAWSALKKTDLEQRTSLATLTGDQLKNAKEAHAQTQELYNNAMNMPDDQLAANWPAIAQQYDAIPGNQKMPLNPNQPLTKQQLQQFGPVLSMHDTYLNEATERQGKLTKLQSDQLSNVKAAGAMDPSSPFYAPSSSAVAMGTAPGAAEIQAGEVKQAARRAGAEEGARLPGEMALARQKQALSQGDPGAAADLLVNHDATLSELKARGATPDFIAATLRAAHNKSGGTYNAQAADAEFQVAKSPANVAFFGSAKSLTDPGGTLDQLAKVAKDIPHNQIPAFNSIADWEKAATGSGPVAGFAASALGVADDYAKVMGGGQGSDTSRLQALKIIAANQSPEQRAASIDRIRGAVNSQKISRIGKNPVLLRMYGDTTPDSPTGADPFSQFGGKAH